MALERITRQGHKVKQSTELRETMHSCLNLLSLPRKWDEIFDFGQEENKFDYCTKS